MLWTREEIVSATSGQWIGEAVAGCEGISIDSRTLQPGDLFVALAGDPGERFQATSRSARDGHDFLKAAAAAGAVAALVHRHGTDSPIPRIEVNDTLDGLWALGRHRRAALGRQAAVIAVTGSSGKTTAKSLFRVVLDASAEPGSLNNHLGVPLSIARTPKSAVAAVYEIGTNHPGEIAPLSKLARPHVAIVLNVQSAHIGNFSGFEALCAEKLSIAEGLESEGTLVLHHELRAALPGRRHALTFGADKAADVCVVELTGDSARYRIRGRAFTARVPGGGVHRALTLAAVLATLMALGRDLASALDLPDGLIPEGRGQVRTAGGVTVLDDSYNANPGSMRAALVDVVARPGRRLALIGEMLELGDESAAWHRELADVVRPLNGFWCVGEGMRVLKDLPNCLGWYARVDAMLVGDVCSGLRARDVLLVKGSNRIFWANKTVDEICRKLDGRGSAGR